MKQSALRYSFCILLVLIALSGLSVNVQARGTDDEDSVVLSAGGGIFYPFQGKSGFNAIVQAAGKVSQQERLGVELEYRNYETKLFKAKDIDTQSYILRGIGQYFFRSSGISPYVGMGINFAVNVFDEDEIERKRSSINIKQGWGFGYGIMGLLGLEVPVGGGLALFGEGRVSGDFQITSYKSRSGNNKLRVESLSGLTGMGGLRMRF
ncbi:MAG: hypothetical protein OEZ57_01860 [Nitrospirota bacterium]|nr:hypothetical protein [Nitrospirota bacterium]MDH5585852.1 hypothetical protein [Nitrospirota bacterium]MDH5773647.1 hypothetical protein [Nitrospirota bacterium]